MSDFHTLHILNKTPDHPRFSECLGMSSSDDALLLTENGVLALTTSRVLGDRTVYALKSDLTARAIDTHQSNVGAIDYQGMVELSLKAKRVICW
ncbi:sulfurtransferase complex subunit TusB [Marinobacter salinexigens]|uniref:Sulfurtransferase complex subunit TusB n=2 Tax=Marinobacter salinexigens TaxID=2919747 RepID=A0A5B0VKA9_9GAMM|nr:sulfurtransferase complex subunit TusB [Marinobacter salinexigens]